MTTYTTERRVLLGAAIGFGALMLLPLTPLATLASGFGFAVSLYGSLVHPSPQTQKALTEKE